MSEPVLCYLKANVLVEQNEKAVETLNRFGIKAGASFIVGSPQETEDDILRTLNFVKGRHLNALLYTFLLPCRELRCGNMLSLKDWFLMTWTGIN